MVQREVWFEGTPSNFAVVVNILGNQQILQRQDGARFVARFGLTPNSNPATVLLSDTRHPGVMGTVLAHSLPNGYSRLVVQIPDGVSEVILPVWKLLAAELQRQGWIESQPTLSVPAEPLNEQNQLSKDKPQAPRRGNHTEIKAVLDWYDKYDPGASNSEIAKYCGNSEETVKGWRRKYSRQKRGGRTTLPNT